MQYQPPYQTPRPPKFPWHEFFLFSAFLPIVGVILGLVKAFHPDPYEKQKAGACFGGAVAGTALGWVLFTTIGPLLTAGPGGAAYNRGIVAYQAGNMRQAETEFQDAVKGSSGFAAAWVALAAAQAGYQNWVGAEASSRQAIALFNAKTPGPIPGEDTAQSIEAAAHGNLAVALANQMKLPEAAAEARQAIATDPANPKVPNWQQIITLAGQ